MKYEIIYCKNEMVLTDAVNDRIKSGYRPHGGVAVSGTGNYERFYQVMVKDND